MKWSEFNRRNDIVFAIWPEYKHKFRWWFMQELVYKSDGSLTWRNRSIPGENDTIRADFHLEWKSAVVIADQLNPNLMNLVRKTIPDSIIARSTELKVQKALQSKRRLQEEEQLMLQEGMRRREKEERPDIQSISLEPGGEHIRQELFDLLTKMPYLKIACFRDQKSNYADVVTLKVNGTWTKPRYASNKGLVSAERAKIANAFDLNSSQHWGKTKAQIRQILLPRANQLLQKASVQRLLAEALARGERVLVSNGIVFWYDGEEIGWTVKETATTKDSDGTAIWKEGTIQSTNHGRLVILPYIKENGEFVKGHTKNGPNDGRALPRHPDHYVDIPFSLYDGDLMIRLMGELPYE